MGIPCDGGIVIIYKIQNKITKNVYVGKTNNFNRRMREHFSAAFNTNSEDYNKLLSKKIREYGKENFECSIIEECEDNIWQEREIYWIKYYNSFHGKGYNETEGGDGVHIGSIYEKYVKEIIQLLQENILTQEEIAFKYNCSASVISNINTGLLLKQTDIIYPIRTNNIKHKHEMIYNYLLYTKKPMTEIAKELNVSYSTVKKMNAGTLNHNPNFIYPLRTVKEQTANRIKQLLKETNLSFADIGRQTNRNYTTVSDINYGITYFDEKENYPLRKPQPCND